MKKLKVFLLALAALWAFTMATFAAQPVKGYAGNNGTDVIPAEDNTVAKDVKYYFDHIEPFSEKFRGHSNSKEVIVRGR